MKKFLLNIRLVYLSCASVIFCGCGNETIKQELTPIDKIYPIIDKIELHNGVATNIRLYVIDSCEYIGNVYGGNGDMITHKGNCKFCANRNKK